MIEPGTQIGPYLVEGLLGRGGMAEVYRVLHTGLDRREALKLLPPQMTFDQQFVARFLHEARIVAALQHPHIATIYSVSAPNDPQPFFTMELIEGGDVFQLLGRARAAGGVLPFEQTLPILSQVAGALDYAHARGVVHRDIKPANILLTPGGNQAKVVDFGIARAAQEGGQRFTQNGLIIGTPEYMSPEQAGNGQQVGPASDQYSLAIVAYEMLTGDPPFRSDNPNSSPMSLMMAHTRDAPPPFLYRMPHLPPHVESVLFRALAKTPGERFASCEAFIKALAFAPPPPLVHAGARPPVLVQPPPIIQQQAWVQPPPQFQPPPHPGGVAPRKFPVALVVLAIIVLLGAGLVGLALLGSSVDKEEAPAGGDTINTLSAPAPSPTPDEEQDRGDAATPTSTPTVISTPEQAWRDYCDCVNRRDVSGAFAFWAENSKVRARGLAHYQKEVFADTQRMNVLSCQKALGNSTTDHSTVLFTAVNVVEGKNAAGLQKTQDFRVTMVNENGQWCIAHTEEYGK